MKILKIKYVAGLVTLKWEQAMGELKSTFTVASGEEPSPEFLKVLKSLKPYLIKYCEVESLDKKLISTTGVSFAFKGEDDRMSVIICGIKTHKNSGGCLTLNTPLKPTEAGEDAAADVVDEKCVNAVDKLITQAKNYIKGEKLQVGMTL